MPDMPEIQWVRKPTQSERATVVALVVERQIDGAAETDCCPCDEKPAHIVVWREDCESDFIVHAYCSSCYDSIWTKGSPGPLFAVVHLPADEESEKPVRHVECPKCSGNGCYKKEPAERCGWCSGSGRAGTPDDLQDCSECNGTGCVLVECDRCEGETVVPADDE